MPKTKLQNIIFTLIMAFVMVYAMVCYNIAISSMIVCLMCPVMSFIATCLFMHPGSQIIALWLQKTVQNFPMAMCWQIFFAGPGVRNAFGVVVGKMAKNKKNEKQCKE